MVTLPIHPGIPPLTPVNTQTTTTVREIKDPAVDSGKFQRELDSLIRPRGLTFSRHAQKRLEMRGIAFTRDGLQRIEGAVDRAAEKGSRDAVVLAGNLSLVVSVTNRTVVTVMSRENMQESVITNIDSAVFA